mmetsp:Transcript_23235/g.59326  ORF Transcript_23235/g.59326 Transcript_23235/m.59326 type:complete len:293 (-) Transcript_23235:313-1191(-)
MLEYIEQQLRALLLVLQQSLRPDALGTLLFEGVAHLRKHPMRILQHPLQLLQLLGLPCTKRDSVLELLYSSTLRLQLLVHIVEQPLQVAQLGVHLDQLLLAPLEQRVSVLQLLGASPELGLEIAHLRPEVHLEVLVPLLRPLALVLRFGKPALQRGRPAGRVRPLLLLGTQRGPGLGQALRGLVPLESQGQAQLAEPPDLPLGALRLLPVPGRRALRGLAKGADQGLVGLLCTQLLSSDALRGHLCLLDECTAEDLLPLLAGVVEVGAVLLHEQVPLGNQLPATLLVVRLEL